MLSRICTMNHRNDLLREPDLNLLYSGTDTVKACLHSNSTGFMSITSQVNASKASQPAKFPWLHKIKAIERNRSSQMLTSWLHTM